jgi:hypothetical protein
MTLKSTELLLQRRQTTAWIEADAIELLLYREQTVKDGAGGRKKTWAPLPNPQRCRVIPARSRSTSLTYTTLRGEVISSKDSLLVGRWDMDVNIGDQFHFGDSAWRVTYVEPDPHQYMTLCQLDELGKDFLETV